MKKSKNDFLKLFIAIFAIIPTLLFADDPSKQSVPLDPTVRYGKLENGLTYYIKHNQKPENRAEFHLVNNVGAILETDAQNGLAHFTEHMCFNGTKNFPGKGILNYFQTIGMQFGRNINAGTGLDATAYMLMQTPVTREGIIDTALLTLKDWSHNVLFTDEEIDAERGVIHEEWRTGKNADERLSNMISPIIYKGSKYAERDIIGTLDVIDNCPYDTLRQFYKDWYRTDLQAIIVVGDIDVGQIEAKIKKVFSDIPAQKNPKPRPTYDVPDNKEPLIAIATDKEAQNTNVDISFKHDYVEPANKNMDYYINSMKRQLYTNMLNSRFNELIQKENPPFVFAFNYYGTYAGNKDAYVLRAMANNNVEYGLKTLLVENERVYQHGFTAGELERAKTDMLRNLEKSFKEKDQQQNARVAFQYRNHFLRNNPTPGIEFEYQFAQKILPAISLDDINQLSKKWITDENIVVSVTGPEKEEIVYPTEERVAALIKEVKSSKLDAYVDQVSNKPLIEKTPVAGKIKSENKENHEITELVLSNNVKVIVKPTKFKEDEILINAFSKGGSSLYPVEDVASAEFATTIASTSGISEFSAIELQKMLTGKVININPYIDELYEGFNGNCAPNDLETALQLIHLYFTNPRFDETASGAIFSRYKAFLQNKSLNPDAVFQDSVSFILADRNPRKTPLSVEKIDAVNFERAKQIYLERFADASDFTFVFTGNIDINKAKPLFETYLGSLPTLNRNENWKDNNIHYPKGKVNKVVEKKLEVAKNTIFVNVNGDFEYNLENRMLLQTINNVLQIRYIERIREEEGGTYSPSIWSTTSHYPTPDFGFNVAFDCAPEKAEKLKGIVYEEIDNMIKNGPSEENLNKVKENFIKNRENELKENRFWLSSIEFNEKNNEDILNHSKYEAIVKSITAEKVKKAAAKLLTQGNIVEIILQPAQ